MATRAPAAPAAAPSHALPSYLDPNHLGPWGTYLQQIDRVTPYLGPLARWVETLKRPKRSLIVDVPIELDNGTIAHFEGYRVQHNTSRGPGKGASVGRRAPRRRAPRSHADPQPQHPSHFTVG